MTVPQALQNEYAELKAEQASFENTKEPVEAEVPAPEIEPEPEPTPIEEPTPKPVATPPQEPDMYKHKFDVINGKYKAEGERYRQKIASMESHMANLEAKAAEATKTDISSVLTDEEREMSEVGSIADKIALARIEEMRNQYDHELTQLKSQFESSQAQQDVAVEERFWRELDSAVPDHEAVNKSDDWQKWLGHIDPLVGMSRQALLNEASANNDAGRVVSFFKAYKSQSGKRTTVVPSVDSQVTPPTQGNEASPATKRTYTADEMNDAYDAMIRGDAGWETTKKELDAAQREGRVTW